MARGAKGKPRRADRHLAPQRGESGTWGSARVFESARRTWSTMVKKVEFSFLSYVSYVSYEPTLWKSAGGLSSSVVVSESVLSTLLPSKPSDVACDVARDVGSSRKACSSSTGEEAAFASLVALAS